METNSNDPLPQHDQITDYHADIQQIEMEGYELVVKKARNALFLAAGLIFIGEMIAMYRTLQAFDATIFGIAVFEAAIFIGLALWTKKKPYTAIICGLSAFILFIILSVIINGYTDGGLGIIKSLFGGIIVKVLILVALIRPLKDAKELQNIKSQNKV
jgi:hypothetical protein